MMITGLSKDTNNLH